MRTVGTLLATCVCALGGCDLVFSINGDQLAVDAADGDGRLPNDGGGLDGGGPDGGGPDGSFDANPNADEDGDGLVDSLDSCPGLVNSAADSDGDGLDDKCDPRACLLGDVLGSFFPLDSLPSSVWTATGQFVDFGDHLVAKPGARFDSFLADGVMHVIELGTRRKGSVSGPWGVDIWPTGNPGGHCQFTARDDSTEISVFGLSADGGSATTSIGVGDTDVVGLRAMVTLDMFGNAQVTCQVIAQATTNGVRVALSAGNFGDGDNAVIEFDDIEIRWLLDYQVPHVTEVCAF